MTHAEDAMQTALFAWIDRNMNRPGFEPLRVAFHPANGGRRNAREAGRLKAMGVRPGVPDVMIPGWAHSLWLPSGGTVAWLGLALELKCGRNQQTAEQAEWGARLRAAGWHYAVVRDDWVEAARLICQYFGLDAAAAGVK